MNISFIWVPLPNLRAPLLTRGLAFDHRFYRCVAGKGLTLAQVTQAEGTPEAVMSREHSARVARMQTDAVGCRTGQRSMNLPLPGAPAARRCAPDT